MRTPRSARGLTLMDAVIAVSLLVLAVMAWLPTRHVRRVLAAEDVAMATLAELGERIDAARAGASQDADGDGRGETPPIAAVAGPADGFQLSPDGHAARRDGYWFAVLVPGGDLLPRLPSENATTADLAEVTYVLMAWPTVPGESGMRAYMRTPLDGLLRHAVDGYPYGGPDDPPSPRVALVERHRGDLRPISLKDGRAWVPPRETLRSRNN